LYSRLQKFKASQATTIRSYNFLGMKSKSSKESRPKKIKETKSNISRNYLHDLMDAKQELLYKKISGIHRQFEGTTT